MSSIKRIVVIGDLHGSSVWKELLKTTKEQRLFESTLYVFIGDYFDSFVYLPIEQIRNFESLVRLKRANPDNVILLIGNHDYHYFPFVNQRYSGYFPETQSYAGNLLKHCLDENLIQLSFKNKNLVITHAGITKTWLKESGIKFENLNKSFKDRWENFGYRYSGSTSDTGNDVFQSPIIIRPESLEKDKIDNFIQIVGHTTKRKIEIQDSVIYVDCLKYKKEFLEIDCTLDSKYIINNFKTFDIEHHDNF